MDPISPSEAPTTAGLSQAYIDELKAKHTAAVQEADEYGQAASKAAGEYQMAQQHRTDLEDFHKRLTETYEAAATLEEVIQLLQDYAGKVCTNVNHSGEAIDILMQCMTCLSIDTEGLSKKISQLLDAIDQLNDPVLTPSNGLIQCIHDLKTEVATAITLHETAIKAVVELLRSVLKMEFLICNDGDNSNGLTADLAELYRVLCCDYCGGIADWTAEDCGNGSASEAVDEGDALEDCCSTGAQAKDCLNEMPRPALCDGKKDSMFFQNLEGDRDNAIELAEQLKCALSYYQKKHASALAKRDAIKNALDAATGAKELCK